MVTRIRICSSAQSVGLKKSIISITLAIMNGVAWHVIPSGKEKIQYTMSLKIIRHSMKKGYNQKPEDKLISQLEMMMAILSI